MYYSFITYLTISSYYFLCLLIANFAYHQTGAVSGNNFSIPLFPIYKSSRFNESNAKLEPYKNKRDSNDGLQVIDLSDRARSVSPLTTTDSKTGGESNKFTFKEKYFTLIVY